MRFVFIAFALLMAGTASAQSSDFFCDDLPDATPDDVHFFCEQTPNKHISPWYRSGLQILVPGIETSSEIYFTLFADENQNNMIVFGAINYDMEGNTDGSWRAIAAYVASTNGGDCAMPVYDTRTGTLVSDADYWRTMSKEEATEYVKRMYDFLKVYFVPTHGMLDGLVNCPSSTIYLP